jgi:glycosyltransferase involved in cell wall biosynthesis
LLGTWQQKVGRYIALSAFARDRFVAGGCPPEKIVVKPNFLGSAPGMKTGRGEYALFVGRLSQEKGVATLLEAFRRVPASMRLKVAGQGPLYWVDSSDSRVDWLGQRSRAEVLELMQGASMLVFPSEWYEGQPLTILEAFATGLPVVASRHGTMAEMVTDGVTGLHFEPRNAEDLARVIEWAFSHPAEIGAIAKRARLEFERKYTPERNYEHLLDIYQSAIAPTKLGKANAAWNA